MDPASTTAAPPVVAWHAASAHEAGSRLGAGLGGLDGAEAERRLRAAGPNVIPARAGEPAVRVLVRQLSSPLIVVLLVAGVVAIALGDYVDGLVVLAVVAVNTAIGFLQEWRAARSIEALDAMLADDAAVVRDGRLRRVPAADVVPGDLLTLAAGDRVAADARIVAARLLELDESPLTGESLPVAKQEAAVDPAAPLGVLALQCTFIYAPPLQQAFGSAPLDGSAWALAAAGALLVLPAVEAEKALRSARDRRDDAVPR